MPASDLPETSLCREAIVKLEALDDVIFAAIDGDPSALESATEAWKETVHDVGATAIAETRCEYLRYARSTWERLKGQAIANPLRLFAVLKIIGLLVGEDV